MIIHLMPKYGKANIEDTDAPGVRVCTWGNGGFVDAAGLSEATTQELRRLGEAYQNLPVSASDDALYTAVDQLQIAANRAAKELAGVGAL